MYDTLHFDNPKGIKMVAHRGCSGLEQENTASAFVAAGNRSYFAIETDVHVTADKEYVVFHDANTKRVAGDEMIVEKTSYDTLRSLKLIDKNGTKDRMDLIIPSLDEYITICRKYEKKCVLELKNHMTPENIDDIIGIIRNLDMLENVIFISFDLPNMICLRQKLPEQKLQFLITTYPDWLVSTLRLHKLDVDLNYAQVTKERVDELHDAGIEVNVWTVDTIEEAQRLSDCGVDYITSNIVE